MIRSLLFSLFAATATASYNDCGSRAVVHSFTVDPPGIVGAGQNVTMDVVFGLRDSLFHDGEVTIHSTWNHLMTSMTTMPMCDHFDCPLLNGTYRWRRQTPFPADVSGRIQTTVRLLNGVGESVLCLQWIAYATGSPSNETSWLVRRLYG